MIILVAGKRPNNAAQADARASAALLQPSSPARAAGRER